MASRLYYCFVYSLFFVACKPAVEESSEAKGWVTSKSFWDKNQGEVSLWNFNCVTEKKVGGKSKIGSYGGGCSYSSDINSDICDDRSVKDTVKNGVPKAVTLNIRKTIRTATCEYIQYASDNFQDSYKNGKCSAWFGFALFYKDTASTSSDNEDIFVIENPSVDGYGTDLKKAIIDSINDNRKGEEKLTCN